MITQIQNTTSIQLNQAVRALQRMWAPLSDSFSIAYAADAGFDGGEFSGPAISCAEQDAYARCVNSVARHFGVPARDLKNAAEVKSHVEFDLWFAAKTRPSTSISH